MWKQDKGGRKGPQGKQAGAGIGLYPVFQELGYIMLDPETTVTESLRMHFNPAADSLPKEQSPLGVVIVSFVIVSKGSSLRATMSNVRCIDLLQYCPGQHLLAIDLQMTLP